MRVKRCLGLNMHSFTTFSFQFQFFSYYCFLDFFFGSFFAWLTLCPNSRLEQANAFSASKLGVSAACNDDNVTRLDEGGGGSQKRKQIKQLFVFIS